LRLDDAEGNHQAASSGDRREYSSLWGHYNPL
jgi:hypothetical protein